LWSKFSHENTIRNGRQYGRSLALLEGFGGLGGVPVWVEEIVEAVTVALYIDNSGFVWAHAKGSSRDDYIYTLAKCLQDFCTGVGVLVKVFYTGRHTSLGVQREHEGGGGGVARGGRCSHPLSFPSHEPTQSHCYLCTRPL
jgi:hypothetical protein